MVFYENVNIFFLIIMHLLCQKNKKKKSSNINLKERKVERTWGTKREELLRAATKAVICNNSKGSDGCEKPGSLVELMILFLQICNFLFLPISNKIIFSLDIVDLSCNNPKFYTIEIFLTKIRVFFSAKNPVEVTPYFFF